MMQTTANKPVSQPCLRNQDPIFQQVQSVLSQPGKLLELACGTAQHAVYMGTRMPHIHWQATEMADRLIGANQWIDEACLNNLPAAQELDINSDNWGEYEASKVDYVFSANLVHFVSDQSVNAIFLGIARVLQKEGSLILYGPYNEDGFTSDGNRNLDHWLKNEIDSMAGIKELESIIQKGKDVGLMFEKKVLMPANNLILIFKMK